MSSINININHQEHLDFGTKSGDINPLHYDDRLGSAIGCEGKVIFGGLIIHKVFNAFDFQQNNYEVESFDIRFNSGASLYSDIKLIFDNDNNGFISFELEQSDRSIAKGSCRYKLTNNSKDKFVELLFDDLANCSERVASWFGYEYGCAVIGRWLIQKQKNTSFSKNLKDSVAKIDPRFDIHTFKAKYNFSHSIEFRYFDGLNNWASSSHEEDYRHVSEKSKKSLIIGGTGSLGLALKRNLIKRSYQVFCSSRYSGGDFIINLINDESHELIYDALVKTQPQVICFCAIDKIDANTKMNLIFKNFFKAIKEYCQDNKSFSIFFPSTYYIDEIDIASSKGLNHYAENKLEQEKQLKELCESFPSINVYIYRLKEFNSRQHALSKENIPDSLDIKLIDDITNNLESLGESDGRRYKIITC
jgi:hypothetical protein